MMSTFIGIIVTLVALVTLTMMFGTRHIESQSTPTPINVVKTNAGP